MGGSSRGDLKQLGYSHTSTVPGTGMELVPMRLTCCVPVHVRRDECPDYGMLPTLFGLLERLHGLVLAYLRHPGPPGALLSGALRIRWGRKARGQGRWGWRLPRDKRGS